MLTMHRTRRALGFTVVEALVVVSTALVILGLTIPTLSMARQSAVILKCESNIRQMGLLVSVYANQHDGFYPFAGYEPHTVSLPNDGEGGPVGGRIGVGSGMWSLLFPDHWSDVDQWDASLRCPKQPGFDREARDRLRAEGASWPIDYSVNPYPAYWIGRGFWTHPQDMKTDADPESLRIRPARTDDVMFPSRKVLSTEFWVFCTNEPDKEFKLYTHGDTASLKGSTLACDGSVRRRARSQGLPGIWGEYSFLDTPDGVWGIDLPD